MVRADRTKLSGLVEVDETYIGGEEHSGSTGRGTGNKVLVEIAVELHEYGNNTAFLLKEQGLDELPYWETINNYFKLIDETELEMVTTQLVKRLIRMQPFCKSRVRGKYWQTIIDGTELCNFGRLDEPHCGHCMSFLEEIRLKSVSQPVLSIET
jgi:hypothetical protein